MRRDPSLHASFDAYACRYDSDLHRGIQLSGEGKEYFAKGRVTWLASCLRLLGEQPRFVMDFGCGIGTGAQALLDILSPEKVVGIDISPASLQVARENCSSERIRFLRDDQYDAKEDIELVYCSGVFHHIPTEKRSSVVKYIYDTLRPGGFCSIWENNPFHPGTRLVMSRIPFDRNAHLLKPGTVRSLLRTCGFQIVRTDYHFIFPNMLRCLRGIEPLLTQLPLGAQYQVLGWKQPFSINSSIHF
jgi:SAM-dependent methyltransferase